MFRCSHTVSKVSSGMGGEVQVQGKVMRGEGVIRRLDSLVVLSLEGNFFGGKATKLRNRVTRKKSTPFISPFVAYFYWSATETFSLGKNRKLKQRRRRRQRKHYKTKGLMSKNNRSARALRILVHFFAVLRKTTT